MLGPDRIGAAPAISREIANATATAFFDNRVANPSDLPSLAGRTPPATTKPFFTSSCLHQELPS
jgi:hypothetical protein